jgi:hypothetical protein
MIEAGIMCPSCKAEMVLDLAYDPAVVKCLACKYELGWEDVNGRGDTCAWEFMEKAKEIKGGK